MKACFVGQREYFEQCSLLTPAGGVEPFFVDHRGGSDPAPVRVALESVRPDVVLVFRPETLPAGFLRGVDALTLGFNTEPIPRGASGSVHPEQAFRLSELAQTDASQFDRIITFDPLGAATAESAGLPVWRSVPLPVADHLYAQSLRPVGRPPRIAFVGYSTEHREQWLTPVKHSYDVLHVVTGLQKREEGEVLIFVDSTAKEIAVKKSDIKQRFESPGSLMVSNFSEIISPDDFNNLLAYLLTK